MKMKVIVSQLTAPWILPLTKKPKHLLQQKHAVEAAKSNQLHSSRVEICLRKICSQRIAACKL